MARSVSTTLCACALGASLLPAGCGVQPPPPAAPALPSKAEEKAPAPSVSAPAAAADPDDVPITLADVKRPADLAEAVVRVKTYHDAIAAGTPTKAHRPLDELNVVLKWLPGIAMEGGVSDVRLAEVEGGANRLKGLFDKMHGEIDATKTPDYAAVSKDVDVSVAQLEGAASK